MPFDQLANKLGNIPPLYQYQPLPVRKPYPTAQVIAAIAEPLLATLDKFSPEEKQKRTLADLEIGLRQAQLNKANDPKLDELERKKTEAQIAALDALKGQRQRSNIPKTNPLDPHEAIANGIWGGGLNKTTDDTGTDNPDDYAPLPGN